MFVFREGTVLLVVAGYGVLLCFKDFLFCTAVSITPLRWWALVAFKVEMRTHLRKRFTFISNYNTLKTSFCVREL